MPHILQKTSRIRQSVDWSILTFKSHIKSTDGRIWIRSFAIDAGHIGGLIAALQNGQFVYVKPVQKIKTGLATFDPDQLGTPFLGHFKGLSKMLKDRAQMGLLHINRKLK